MLDSDISTADALRHLSVPEAAFGDTDAHTLDRRRFLQLVGMGLGAGVVAGPGTTLLDAALGGGDTSWAAGPIGANDGVVIVLGMFGGNDGLNTVVPITDGRYYDQHGDIAIAPEDTLPIDAQTGLHPALGSLKQFWDAGQLAIVEGVGYPNPDLSHFSSMAKWMSGRPSGIPSSGWVGRWLDGYLNGSKDLFAAAEVGHSVPLHMIGEASRATAIPASRPSFGANAEPRFQRQYQTVRRLAASAPGFWERQIGQAFVDQLDVGATIAPVIPEELPEDELTRRLEVAARLVNANLGFRILTAGWGDFDSHAGQPQQHPLRMQELDSAVRRFYQVLDPVWASRATFMTFSEFGRTCFSNDGAGTDHGTSAPHFVFGANVRGGRYGQRPTLAGLERWERMAHHVDFRDYFGSVIDGWLGGGGSDVLAKPIANLGLFARGPGGSATVDPGTGSDPGTGGSGGGSGGGTGTPTPSSLTTLHALVPHRLVDTREGLGAPRRKVRPGETVVVSTRGTPGLPTTGVRSVVVNVTATESTRDTYFMVYPRGGVKPTDASCLNPGAHRDCSNYVVTPVDANGDFLLYNHSADTHLVVDITGYGAASGGVMLNPLPPARLLDTRKGIGAPLARLRGGRSIDLQVTGRGGVPDAGVDSVVVNVTTVGASKRGFVAAHSTDVKRPTSSNANYSPGHIVSNTMICKVGGNGRIRIFVNAGEVDMVLDVTGWYGATGSRLVAADPSRILDTREGNGAPKRPLTARQVLPLQVRGRGNVPSDATAVVLNLTAVTPSADGYVTAYPTDATRTETSSINMVRGETLANLVVSKLGPDGAINLYNHAGSVELVADVTGWFV